MKKIIFIIAALAAAVGCQKSLIQQKGEGSISVSLENSPVVEVVTKAGETVSADGFNVYVSSVNGTTSHIYNGPMNLVVPVGMYSVSADNITEAQSFEGWGQVRYAGASEEKQVVAGAAPTSFDLVCTMANAAVSVVFDSSIATYFQEGFTVTAYNTEDRKLVYNASNTAGEPPVAGYFKPGTLHFAFSGNFMENAEPLVIEDTRTLRAATHLHLTFRISTQNGQAGITVDVDDSCEDLYESITVDPSEGGSFVTE